MVRRADGSGDTFLFTSLLTDTNKVWKGHYGFNTTVNWPSVSGEVAATGNSGIVTALENNPYSISYVGISYLKGSMASGRLGEAAIQNKAGNFLLPTPTTIEAAAKTGAPATPKNESISLIYEPGKYSYPIINFEYAIVNTNQNDPNVATAMNAFLTWAIDPKGGNQAKYLTPVNFLPLPTNVYKLSKAQIDRI